MRCRKHPSESTLGVCASCLRERLLNLRAQEEERRFQFRQFLHDMSSPSTVYEERAQKSEEREADNLHERLGILLSDSERQTQSAVRGRNTYAADSEKQSQSAIRGRNTNPEGEPNRRQLSLGLSRFMTSPDVGKSTHTYISPVNNHILGEGFKENEVASSSPHEELPHKPSSWIYSWLLRKKKKTNQVESSYQTNNVAGKSFITAMPSLDDNKKCLKDLDLFNRHQEALCAQLSPIQHNLRVFSAKHYAEQKINCFSSSSFQSKPGRKMFNIFRKEPSERSTPQRYRESVNSKVEDCSESGSIHQRKVLFYRHARGASPSSSVIMESEADQRASPLKLRGFTCDSNFVGAFSSPKVKAGKTEGIQIGGNFNDCAGSFSPYVERRSMQSPKRFPVVSNELCRLRFCLSPLRKPGRKCYPQANI